MLHAENVCLEVNMYVLLWSLWSYVVPLLLSASQLCSGKFDMSTCVRAVQDRRSDTNFVTVAVTNCAAMVLMVFMVASIWFQCSYEPFSQAAVTFAKWWISHCTFTLSSSIACNLILWWPCVNCCDLSARANAISAVVWAKQARTGWGHICRLLNMEMNYSFERKLGLSSALPKQDRTLFPASDVFTKWTCWGKMCVCVCVCVCVCARACVYAYKTQSWTGANNSL